MVATTPRNIGALAIPTYIGGDSPEEVRDRVNRRQVDFSQVSLDYDTAPFLYLPAGPRTYFLLQNLDAAFNIFVGFGTLPNAALGVGLRISAGDAYEPYMIPQNDVFICGTGVGSATLIYAVD
jgi:hypothetical protein